MIVDLIVTAVLGVVSGALNLLPSVTFPSVEGTAQQLGQGLAAIQGVFPVVTLLEVVAAGIAFSLLMSGINAAIFLFHQFWGSS